MPKQKKQSDKIFIKDLVIEMFAGIYDHEKANKQHVIINITLDVESNKGKTLRSIDDVVSYEDITNKVISLTNEKHYELLEELAEKIAILCLNDKRVLSSTIKLEKPDIIADAQSVGIEIYRKNNQI